MGLNRQNLKMTPKPVPTSGRFKVTSSLAITTNLESNSMCRQKHFLFHWNRYILMWLDLRTLIWTSCKRSALTIIGILIWTEVCQTHGKVAHKLHYWKKNLPRDICGPGWDWQKFKQPHDQITCDLKYGSKIGKSAQNRENRNGQLKSQNWKMLDNWEEFISLIQMKKNVGIQWWMRGENWKHRWHPPCPVKEWTAIASGDGSVSWLHLQRFRRRDMVV